MSLFKMVQVSHGFICCLTFAVVVSAPPLERCWPKFGGSPVKTQIVPPSVQTAQNVESPDISHVACIDACAATWMRRDWDIRFLTLRPLCLTVLATVLC